MDRIISEPSTRDKLAEIVFKETSTIGIRYYPVNRMILKRVPLRLKTRFGTVGVKMIEEPDGEKRAIPEYDEMKKLAEVKRVPIKRLYDEVLRSFKEKGRKSRKR